MSIEYGLPTRCTPAECYVNLTQICTHHIGGTSLGRMDAQILENKHLKIGLFAPAEQYVYRIWIADGLHSSGVLCTKQLF